MLALGALEHKDGPGYESYTGSNYILHEFKNSMQFIRKYKYSLFILIRWTVISYKQHIYIHQSIYLPTMWKMIYNFDDMKVEKQQLYYIIIQAKTVIYFL